MAESAAKAATSSVLTALRDKPSFLILLSSVPEPDLLQRMLTAVRNEAMVLTSSSSSVPIVGCSTLKWSCWGRSSISSRSRESLGRSHITLSAASLAPGIQVSSFETAGDSLPSFPPRFDLAKAIMAAQKKKSSRATPPSSSLPQFLLFSHSESDLSGLRSRLDKLFCPSTAMDGACLASAAGSLSMSFRKTAVLNPHAPIGMGLTMQPLGSDFPVPLNQGQAAPEPMAFCDDAIQKSSGCTGLIFYPWSPGGADEGPKGLSPSSSALMARVLLGQDRFASLELSESTLSLIRPPPTSPGEFVTLNWGPKVSSARKASGGPVIKGLPLFEIGRDFLLFPGQTTQMRIFEKRYQLLMRQLIESQGILGLPIGGSKERGITAVVKSYLLNGGDFYVTVEGLTRFESDSNLSSGGGGGGKKAGSGRGSSCRVLPSSFGLTAINAQAMADEAPKDDAEVKEVMGLAKEAVRLIHEGASLAMVPQKDEGSVKASSLFLSALHLAGRTNQLPASSPSLVASSPSLVASSPSLVAAAVKENDPPVVKQESPPEVPSAKDAEQGQLVSSSAHYHPRLQSQLAERAIQSLDKRGWEAAMDLSLLLGGVMPVEAEARKTWLASLSTVQRLKDQVKRLRELPNLKLASSVEVLRLREGHHLRVSLGLPWTIN